MFPFLSYSQDKLPNSIVNVGAGAGVNYGIFGAKTVVGYRNSGLLVGLGYVPGGFLGYEIGVQLSIQWIYVSLGYGVFGTRKVNNDPVKALEAGNVLIGGMIGLGEEKRIFIDLGVGHTFGAPSYTPLGGGFSADENAWLAVIGIGIRLGTVVRSEKK